MKLYESSVIAPPCEGPTFCTSKNQWKRLNKQGLRVNRLYKPVKRRMAENAEFLHAAAEENEEEELIESDEEDGGQESGGEGEVNEEDFDEWDEDEDEDEDEDDDHDEEMDNEGDEGNEIDYELRLGGVHLEGEGLHRIVGTVEDLSSLLIAATEQERSYQQGMHGIVACRCERSFRYRTVALRARCRCGEG